MMGLLPQARRLLAYIVTMERQGERWTWQQAADHLELQRRWAAHFHGRQLIDRGYAQHVDGRLAPTAAGFAVVPRLEGFRFIAAPHDLGPGRAIA